MADFDNGGQAFRDPPSPFVAGGDDLALDTGGWVTFPGTIQVVYEGRLHVVDTQVCFKGVPPELHPAVAALAAGVRRLHVSGPPTPEESKRLQKADKRPWWRF